MTVRPPLRPPAEQGEVVRDYDILQTTEINKNITEITWLRQKVNEMLAKVGIMSDWVVESGSNANGNWEKWNSGKLVQWGRFNFDRPINTVIGSGYRGAMNLTFPVPFLAGTVPSFINSGANYAFPSATNTMTNVSVDIQMLSLDNNRIPGLLGWHAIGRWK